MKNKDRTESGDTFYADNAPAKCRKDILGSMLLLAPVSDEVCGKKLGPLAELPSKRRVVSIGKAALFPGSLIRRVTRDYSKIFEEGSTCARNGPARWGPRFPCNSRDGTEHFLRVFGAARESLYKNCFSRTKGNAGNEIRGPHYGALPVVGGSLAECSFPA